MCHVVHWIVGLYKLLLPKVHTALATNQYAYVRKLFISEVLSHALIWVDRLAHIYNLFIVIEDVHRGSSKVCDPHLLAM